MAELAAMAGTKPTRPGPKPALTGAALRKAIMAIWCLCFCGMQWRAIGQLCDTRSARCSPCFRAGPGLVCGTGCAAPGGWRFRTGATFIRQPDRMLLADLIHGFGREMVG
jgi:hypothetical protein